MSEAKTAYEVPIFSIPECNWDELQKRMEKLQKKAVKLQLSPPELVVLHHEDVPLVKRDNMTDMLDFGYDRGTVQEKRNPGPKDLIVGYRRYYIVELKGEAPVIPGWSLVAVIEHGNTELGNILRVVPGMTCPYQYRQADALCEHCGHTRRRLETFVLLSSDGVHKQVGRNCLADFCRNPEAAKGLCDYAQIIASCRGLCSGSEDEEFFGMGGRTIERAPVEAVLAMTARIIRHCGWLSRSKARELMTGATATADIVSEIFFNPRFFKRDSSTSKEERELQDAANDVQERDETLAEQALSWIRSMRDQAETLSDYLYNALVVASEETVVCKHLGILCSVVSSYQRHLEKSEERKQAERQRAASDWFGEVKKRGDFTLTLLGTKSFDSPFGVKFLYRFIDGSGNIAVWWTTKDEEVEVGKAYKVRATVKAHEDYRGTKQTVLTRCAVEELEVPA